MKLQLVSRTAAKHSSLDSTHTHTHTRMGLITRPRNARPRPRFADTRRPRGRLRGPPSACASALTAAAPMKRQAGRSVPRPQPLAGDAMAAPPHVPQSRRAPLPEIPLGEARWGRDKRWRTTAWEALTKNMGGRAWLNNVQPHPGMYTMGWGKRVAFSLPLPPPPVSLARCVLCGHRLAHSNCDWMPPANSCTRTSLSPTHLSHSSRPAPRHAEGPPPMGRSYSPWPHAARATTHTPALPKRMRYSNISRRALCATRPWATPP